IADLLSLEENRGPGAIRVTLESEDEPAGKHVVRAGLRVSFEPKPARLRAKQSQATSTLRREIQTTLRWSTIRRLQEQVEFVRVELNYGPRSPTRLQRDNPDISLLMSEHHRLAKPLEALESVYADVVKLEDVEVAAQIAGIPTTPP